MKGLGLAIKSFKIKLVIIAPQQTAPNIHIPTFLVFLNNINIIAIKSNNIPFSVIKLKKLNNGVKKFPKLSASLCKKLKML